MLSQDEYNEAYDKMDKAIREHDGVRDSVTVHTLPHFTRTELQAIGTCAHELANVGGLNAEWRQVYEQLALAASTLDAFLARAELALVIEKYAPAGEKTGVSQDQKQSTLWDWDERPTGVATFDSPSEAH